MKAPRKVLITILGVLVVLASQTPSPVAQGQTTMVQLTIRMVGMGDPSVSGVVGTNFGQLCNTGSDCSYQVPSGTEVRLRANSPWGSTPGAFSLGTGSAGACAPTSTCRFVIDQNSEITATFNANAPVLKMSVILAGDGPGDVNADNDRCQNYDYDLADLPTLFSACDTAYAPGSEVTVESAPPAGSRFVGFSNGTNNAAVCSTDPCSFLLGAATSVTATFAALTSIAVSPASDTLNINQSHFFTADGTFTDHVTEPITGTKGTGTWTTRASLQHARFDFGATVARSRIFAIGGVDLAGPLATVEAFNPTSNTWAYAPSMSASRAGLGVGTIDDHLVYAVGGSTSNACPVDTLEVYDADVPAGGWSTLEPMPGGARRALSAAVVGQTLYAMGGDTGACNTTSGTRVNRVEAYTPGVGWTTKASMPTARRFFGVGVVNGIVYAVGGDDETNILSTVEAYDPVTNSWSTKHPLPSPRSLLAVAVIDNVLYAVGGNNNGYSSTVFAYDSATDSWSNRQSIPLLVDVDMNQNVPGQIGVSGDRAELGAASLDGRMYAIGGLRLSGGIPPVPYVTVFVDHFIWSADNTNVATISQFQGRATGKHAGATTIRARAGTVTCGDPGGQCATLTVTSIVDPPSGGGGGGGAQIFLGIPQSTSTNVNSTPWGCGSFSDTNASGGSWSATVNYGDASGPQPLPLEIPPAPGNPCVSSSGTPPTGAFLFNHPYGSPGQFNVSVTVTNTVTGTSKTGGFVVTVEDGGGGGSDECAEVTLTITGSNLPFDHVLLTVTTDEGVDGPFEVPVGTNTFSISAGSYHLAFAAPAGFSDYMVVPAENDFAVSCGESATVAVQIQRPDTAPPVIASVTPSTGVLWPPNHKMVGVSVNVQATDNVGTPACTIQSVTSNEPIDGLDDGDTAPDWMVTGPFTLDLRAERGGKGVGRVYTITASCSDGAGNTSTGTTQVRVPHNQGK
jgi:N-acetylneuraminic acid mutarotase